jgi:predicted ester cyclase
MSKEEENKDLTRQYHEDCNAIKGNPARVRAMVDKYYAPNWVGHSDTGDINREQWKQFAIPLYKAFPDINFTIEDIVAEGDKVVARFTWRGTHNGEWLGVPPTGKKVSQTVISIYRIAGRKILEGWAVGDMLGLMQQLGALPKP